MGVSVPWGGGSLVSLPRSAPNNALEPTAPMAVCGSRTSLVARRLTAGVGHPKKESCHE